MKTQERFENLELQCNKLVAQNQAEIAANVALIKENHELKDKIETLYYKIAQQHNEIESLKLKIK